MTTYHYDVIVIGAGPAGIAAGLTVLQNGYKVLLITGGGSRFNDTIESIHPGVLSLLRQLGIMDLSSDCILGAYQFISDGTDRKSLNPYTDEIWTGFHISKREFIRHILEEARCQKLQILEMVAVTDIIKENGRVVGVKTDKEGLFYSRYVIDATGNKKLLGWKLRFIQRYYSLPYIALTGKCSGVVYKDLNPESAYFIPEKDGWTWLAQLSDESFYWTKLLTKKTTSASISEKLTYFEVPCLHRSANMRWRIFRPVCTEGAILCGDAACLIDPAGGQGILNALTHGIQAATVVSACLKYQPMEVFYLAEYDNWIFERFKERVDKLKDVYKELGLVSP